MQLSRLVVQSDTPGFTAQIQATNIEGGTPQTISAKQAVGQRTSFDLHQTAPMRYYVIWITKLPANLNYAHINEVHAFKS